ncbi:MAG: hypothetical protein H6539_03175 [Bacteroidales bacterium]|nr:hypothetical protein [Bacteroidales bacterium]
MKTILYALLAIVIFGIISTGFVKKSNATATTIVLQSTDKNVSIDNLMNSADIIKNRLKTYSSEPFDIYLLKEKNQIKVSFRNNQDISTFSKLLVQKGEFLFAPVYDRKELQELLHGDNHLFSLLETDSANFPDSKIGCVSASKVSEINAFLTSVGVSPTCKFVWGKSAKSSEDCLYALQLGDTKEGIITGADIDYVKSVPDKSSAAYEIEITFRESAVSKWADVSRMNIGRNMAVVLDDSLFFNPVLKSEIKGGNCTIAGNFTESEANYFAALASYGVLPLNFEIVK